MKIEKNSALLVKKIHLKLINLHDAMFCESSPGPVKFAAEKIGLCKSEARLPIVEISDASKEKVLNAIKSIKTINNAQFVCKNCKYISEIKQGTVLTSNYTNKEE